MLGAEKNMSTSIKVIWKRPDGFHGAKPSDFIVIELKTHSSRIWLHHIDHENFPFRVSGGWQEEAQTRKLNQMVNLLKADQKEVSRFFEASFENSQFEDKKTYVSDLVSWLSHLKSHLKGDTWELAVMNDVFDELLLLVSQIV